MTNKAEEHTRLLVVPEVDAEQSICLNCKASLNGPYCAQCGQSTESTIKYFWSVVLHLLDDIFSFDSRASRTIWPLMTRPGFLTNEYILGRRVFYVPPLRLYLFISIIFFITLRFFAVSENNNVIGIGIDESTLTQVTAHISELEQQRDFLLAQENQDQSEAILLVQQNLERYNLYKTDLSSEKNNLLPVITKELVELDQQQVKSGKPLIPRDQKRYNNLTQQLVKVKNGEKVSLLSLGSESDGVLSFPFLSTEKNALVNDMVRQLEEKALKVMRGDSGPLLEQIIGTLPQLMFVLLPIFAALLKLMFLFSNRLYMEHLTVALHSHSFVFINILLIEFIDIVQDHTTIAWQWVDTALTVLSICLLAWIPVYLYIMQKRVYKQGYFMTTIKYLTVGLTYWVLICITAIIAFVWGLTNV